LVRDGVRCFATGQHAMFGQKSSHLPTRSRYHCQEISKKHYIVVVDEVRIWACWGGANLPESQLTKNIRYKSRYHIVFGAINTAHQKTGNDDIKGFRSLQFLPTSWRNHNFVLAD
jgi:hypothetical protein